ncbi:MAG: sugar phosphate isomerase/epimerase [Phycisphaerales bacterium]|nr:sugar phosphate isomerase/epimerase [Phycisphaerales bacterium]
MNRRDFLHASTLSAAGLALGACASSHAHASAQDQPAAQPEKPSMAKPPAFKISLAEWSFHRAIKAGEMTNLDFPRVTREDYGIEAVEYVNQFFMDKPKDEAYLADLKKRCDDHGIYSNLIMCDSLGELGNPDGGRRNQTVENHKPWVQAAAYLGCQALRVNAASSGTYEEQQRLAADGLRKLVEYAAKYNLNLIVENHGGLSSNGEWLSGVMKLVDHPRMGTLPDFGNFCLDWAHKDDPTAWYDRYKGVTEMMPYARAVSAKSHDFDEHGEETTTDYHRMLKIVTDAGYHSYLGIEYEGEKLGEPEGVRATLALLERVRAELSV